MQQQPIILGRYDKGTGETGDYGLAAFLLLALGAALRFYQLGVPSMWTDEMLVALNASKSVPYIISLAENVEVHPPFFYFFTKAMLAAGASDFWLRLPSAVFGTLSLLVLWRVGERHLGSRFAALAALGFLATHPLHIWISRQLRPYALISLCAVLALGFLLRYLEEGKGSSARRTLYACLPLALSHYLGFLVLGTQWLVSFAASLVRGVPGVASTLWFGLGTALCAAPAAWFFWDAKVRRQEAVIAAGKGYGPALDKVLDALQGVLAFGMDLPFAWVALAALMVAGTLALLFRRSAAVALAALFVLPPLALVLAQYASHLYAVHLSFLLPVAVLLAGAGAEGLAPGAWRRPFTVVLLSLCLAGAFVGLKGKAFYDSKGVVATWWHMGFYKDIASTLRANFKPTDMISFHDLGLFESVNWYASQLDGAGAPASQTLGPDKPSVMAVFVTNYGEFGHFFQSEAQFREMFGDAGAVAQRDNIRLYQAAIARQPDMALSGPGFVAELTGKPTDVYARAWTLRDLSVWPYFGCALFPTKPRQPGEVVYRFTRAEAEGENAGEALSRFALLADFELDASGNLLKVEYRFDDEPWSALIEETGASKGTCRLARFTRNAPYTHLWLRATLMAGEKTATSEMSALGQAKLSRLLLCADQDGARFGSSTLALAESGLGTLERLPGDVLMRWGLGQGSSLEYRLDEARPLALSYRFTSRLPGQSVEVLADGERVALHENLEQGQEVDQRLEIPGKAGAGRIELRYTRWNHKDAGSTFAPGDPRQIAVSFMDLTLEAPGLAGAAVPPQVLPK
ncbi:glycosyltransferase family 39 protein [Fundidesulfovibrio putealis]|uniref:glycosyltransferase family 39 protein n=1 Tax=Fundidesulfovibrio putealis TaxID=270496 RepID=UPI00041EFC90|nr:glycosyltransferase family 39 protein [Fundidesulfovibrio putealis]